MKIVVAPDSYKVSVSAMGVADAMENGIRRVFPNAVVRKIPIADGGEGTVEPVSYTHLDVYKRQGMHRRR